ncbi:glycosyl hydrolase [Pseudarthrobacter sp. PvP090]|uniref:glycosyl hydrolase n=1 Tax=Pseudarthrobacter sp. PvP090 TaxID=3156393 RepID=UPI003394A687
MDRRTFLTVPLAALAAPGTFLAPGAKPFPAPPRTEFAPAAAPRTWALKGAAHGGDDAEALRQIQSLQADWYYSWAAAYTVTTRPGFVPMVFSARALFELDAIGDVMRQLPETQTRHLLGFNEPDHAGQSNMSVDEAIRLWPQLQSTGLSLGSPGTTNAAGPWLDQFMTKARGANLRVDFIAVHCYTAPHTGSFLARLVSLHAKYGLPIWVTEFAVADWSATPARPSRYTGLEIRRFMRDTVAGMRAMPFVERFAWKTRGPFDPIMGESALYDTDGQLTATGRLYASL